MEITKDTKIGELVAKDFRLASVFDERGIDFCCNGNRSLGSACENSGDVESLIGDIEKVLSQKNTSAMDYNSWPLDLLADYIEKKHHRYVEEKSREITPYIEKIRIVHGANHPELARVEELFKTSVGEMAKHMKKEELMLFPAIRKMVAAQGSPASGNFDKVRENIEKMMAEHDDEGARFHEIEALTSDYAIPADGCNTYMATMKMLQEFDSDLHLHIHLENNILFPKSIELAKELAAAATA